ncbi:MAG TPA: alpha/beta hydrolase [Acidimicrobiia bacterium]|nr:alpha/beta hydrolase [Acidimicrobiia bacterium]
MPQALQEERLATPLGKIQLFRGGEGPPLVYLHSAGGETVHPALEDLADDHEVFVPVFPGFGESEGIEHIGDMEDAVFHLLDVWDLLGLDAPSVMGMSLGGWMALELATRYPDRVSKLVLVNPVGIYLPGNPIHELFGRSPAELAEEMFADQSHPMAQIMHAMAEFTGDVGKQVEIPMELVLPIYTSLSATARLGWDPYLHNPKLRGRLRRVTAPALVVRGAEDGFVPAEYAETFAAELPDARLEVVEGAAHLLAVEQPEALARLTRVFLQAPLAR